MSIKVEHLSHVYMEGTPFEAHALKDISLSIADGAFIGIIGHTGSGKSTLITHLNALETSPAGTVFVDDLDINGEGVKLNTVRQKIGLVFQYPEYQLFEETVAKDIAFGPRNLKLSEEEITRRVEQAAAQVGLEPHLLEKSPFELSGGQKRRVAIAGVLAMDPQILILDEPAAGLDPVGRRDMLKLISDIHKTGRTVIMVSHSMDDVGSLCDCLFVLNHGKIAFSGTPAEVFTHVEELQSIGLDVPECAKLANLLRTRGFDIPERIYSMDDVCAAIERELNGGKQNA